MAFNSTTTIINSALTGMETNKADIDLHTVTWIDLKTVLSEK